MNKKDFISSLAGKLGIKTSSANDLLNVVLTEIQDSLISCNEVNFKWFGKFSLRKRNAKNGYDMHKKKIISIPAFTTVIFKPSKNIKKLVKKI